MIDQSFSKIIITTDQRSITLRLPSIDDIHTIHDFYNRTVVEDTFTLFSRPLSSTEAIDYLNNLIKLSIWGNGFYLGAYDGTKYIGSASINVQGFREHHVGKLGIVLDKDYRNLGIGRQIIQASLDLAHTSLNLKMIILDCFSTNEVAIKLYHSLGFTEIGRIPKAVYYKNEYVDKVFMYIDL